MAKRAVLVNPVTPGELLWEEFMVPMDLSRYLERLGRLMAKLTTGVQGVNPRGVQGGADVRFREGTSEGTELDGRALPVSPRYQSKGPREIGGPSSFAGVHGGSGCGRARELGVVGGCLLNTAGTMRRPNTAAAVAASKASRMPT